MPSVTVGPHQHAGHQAKHSKERYDSDTLAPDRGCFGIRVHHPDALAGFLEQGLASGRPAVEDVISGINGIAPRAWTPA